MPSRPRSAALLAAILLASGGATRADTVAQRADALRAAPGLTVSTLGVTRAGADIPLVTLGDPDGKPAILIVAGLNGEHRAGVDTAFALAERLARDHADLLKTTTIHIIPAANLDALDSTRTPRDSRERTRSIADDDRDRRTDEDPPDDLNGDGVITLMRVKNPPPHIPRTHVEDPDNPGILREADASKSEVAVYAVLPEGRDDDGDGRFNEDGPGGPRSVDLDRNFPHLWPEHEPGAGSHPLCEPESLALVRFVLDHESIAAVLVFGPHDTLVTLPQTGKTDATKRVPLGIEEADKPHYERIGKAFKDATKITAVSPAVDRDDKGAFWSWAYAQAGAWSFSTPVWVRPDQRTQDDTKGDDGEKSEKAEKPAKREGKKTDSDDAKWLALARERAAAASGTAGFVEWTAFRHPQLGEVEIGGFTPGFQMHAPADEVDRLANEQAAFVKALADELPRLTLDEPVVERVGESVFRVSITARNTGRLPTASAMAVKAASRRPLVLRCDVEERSLLAGERVQRAASIAGGDERRFEWLVAGRPGSTVTITVRSPQTGEREIAVPLRVKEARR